MKCTARMLGVAFVCLIGASACGNIDDEYDPGVEEFEAQEQPLDEYLSWRGHTIGRWDTVQEQFNDDIKMASSPGGRSGQAIRFRVTPKSKPIDQGRPRERAEVARAKLEKPGTAAEYTWSTYFPSNFKPAKNTTHNTFTQFHHVPFTSGGVASGQANVSFLIDSRPGYGKERIKVVVRGGNINNPQIKTFDLGRLRRGKWYDFSFRVKWSATNNGFFRVRVNGQPKVKWHNRKTLYSGNPGVKLKQGFYRHHSNFNTVIYHDNMKRWSLR